jgi:hypothetical protein
MRDTSKFPDQLICFTAYYYVTKLHHCIHSLRLALVDAVVYAVLRKYIILRRVTDRRHCA